MNVLIFIGLYIFALFWFIGTGDYFYRKYGIPAINPCDYDITWKVALGLIFVSLDGFYILIIYILVF